MMLSSIILLLEYFFYDPKREERENVYAWRKKINSWCHANKLVSLRREFAIYCTSNEEGERTVGERMFRKPLVRGKKAQKDRLLEWVDTDTQWRNI